MENFPVANYISVNYPSIPFKEISNCYLCGKALADKITLDHIIPDNLFRKDDPCRPQLPVHWTCNNQKSKEDQWFIKQLQIRCSFNPEAYLEISKMIDKAISEKPDAYIIGRKVPNLKLTKGIFNKITWGIELPYKGKTYLQMRVTNNDAERFQNYVRTMCRGLFIRNVSAADPKSPDLIMRQYVDLDLRGLTGNFLKGIESFVASTTATRFGQRWGKKISYIGSRVAETPDKGFLFLQFYSHLGILAVFI